MKNGGGKTLVATLAVYLNALPGKGVHVVTVNDYLAKRDSEWMGRIFRFLGLTVGVIQHNLDDAQRQVAYAADITYGTNNEFGFDYLRDNMKFDLGSYVQRGHHFAVVDEVDSILIDEARTPLIISGPAEESTNKYCRINAIIPKLKPGARITGDKKADERAELEKTGDYIVDEKAKTVTLTEQGMLHAERLLAVQNLWDPSNMEVLHHVNQGLRAHTLFQRDVDYVVKDGQVVIVDEFTGRLMPGRRWSDGLHQAIEAKEKVKIERENQTLATITFQNYFRMFKKLAGMTGTAETEAAEFQKIYNLDVVVIPTNRLMLRKEFQDVVYRTEEEKFRNSAKEIKELYEKGQPVLVGTISVEKSERLSNSLKKMGVKHEVLNAKNHERQASIVAQAGRKGAITVSTNMAGRGTDILLGGNPEFLTKEHLKKQNKDPDLLQTSAVGTPERSEWDAIFSRYKDETSVEHDEVVALGGLHVLGTERHESRRIDNQLRGRSGRQGDPGSSRFYLSLQDEQIGIFAGERMQNLMLRLGMEEDVPIESRLITKRIAAAQKAVEVQNFEARKPLIEYDDVMNKQRRAVYGLRRSLLEGMDQKEHVMDMVGGALATLIDIRCSTGSHPDTWDLSGLRQDVLNQFGHKIDVNELAGLQREALEDVLFEQLAQKYQQKEDLIGADLMRQSERWIMLKVIDDQWKDHLLSIDSLKEGIGLRGYGQKDPLVEYKKESYDLFEAMMDRIEDETVRLLFFLQIAQDPGEGGRPRLPFNIDEDGYEGGEEEAPDAAETQQQRSIAQTSIEDVTRSIQRKKEKELAELQMVGGDGSSTGSNKQVINAA